MSHPIPVRPTRKERIGEVISNRIAKTIIVRVERRFAHPKFSKVVTAYSKFVAHDEEGRARIGDRVRIAESRPLSKTKRWRLVDVIQTQGTPAPAAV